MVVLSGDLSSRRDIIVEGRVEVDDTLFVRRLTIGPTGFVYGDVHGSMILIEGEAQGRLVGEESITIRSSGRVRGSLCAPRVDLEKGARLQGKVEMDPRR